MPICADGRTRGLIVPPNLRLDRRKVSMGDRQKWWAFLDFYFTTQLHNHRLLGQHGIEVL